MAPKIPASLADGVAASNSSGTPSEEACRFYRATMATLAAADIDFLVGGAYAFARYTGIERHTKDFDLFLRPDDVERALAALAASAATELTFSHWLAKAYGGDAFVDVIFGSGNGLAPVDGEWFAHAVADEVLGVPARLVPPEEMLWQKAFVMERERFDGADVNHLLRARAADLDWPRLLRRFGEHWRVLLGHLVFFGYVYPSEANRIPGWVMGELLARLATDLDDPEPVEPTCRGPFISREQYLVDVERWGYRDPRLEANGGSMRSTEVEEWTAAIDEADGKTARTRRESKVESRE
jgi:hypothetical protein